MSDTIQRCRTTTPWYVTHCAANQAQTISVYDNGMVRLHAAGRTLVYLPTDQPDVTREAALCRQLNELAGGAGEPCTVCEPPQAIKPGPRAWVRAQEERDEAIARARFVETRLKRHGEALRETLAAMRGLAVERGRCRLCLKMLTLGPHADNCAIGRAEQTARKAMEG